MEIFLVGVEQIEALSVLFDQYRVFYEQSSDIEAARTFLRERFQNRDSVIFAACEYGQIVGFTQLYPSFSSVSMKRVWILNDLFVVATHRRKGIARLLMETAKQYAQETEAVRIVLSTKISNTLAQALYESLGYAKDEEFYHYSLRLL
jgi:ribosomal protein S18 acetylase RimI-like enzyme